MKLLKLPLNWLWCAALGASLSAAFAQSPVVISEVLFNPPGTDTPHEYIELRALPSYVLPQGTFFVAVDGDFSGGSNPGSIENLIDLSGRKFSTNGFMILLQKGQFYTVNPSAAVLINSGSGPGWGSGPSSSIGHQGDNDKTELENASVTFLLIHAQFTPEPGDDIDENNDGAPDGPYLDWTVLDSVGVLDGTGDGDYAYGTINFRWNSPPGNGAGALGNVVSVGFTASYVGRRANTTGSLAEDWAACDNLAGTAPNWTLPATQPPTTYPEIFATRGLNHIGARNFGAPPLRGLVITPSGGRTAVAEGGGTDSYALGLNAMPAGNVVVQVTAPPGLQVSTDGVGFSSSLALTFNSLAQQIVIVAAPNDNTVNGSPFARNVMHTILNTADPSFPQTLALAPAPVEVIENDVVLLNEIKVNPPGSVDAPHEFIELRGAPGALLNNVHFVALEGDDGGDPGTTDMVINLSGRSLGANGLLLMAGAGHGYSVAPETTVVTVPALSSAGGVLGNGSASFLLLGTLANIPNGADLDGGDNGVLEGLPIGTMILDAVGWRDGNTDDVVYGGVMLVDGDIPDAAARFPANQTPSSAAAWFFGDLTGTASASLIFDWEDPQNVSANFPVGTDLSPGATNPVEAYFLPVTPVAGAIGDPTNPKAYFKVVGLSVPVTVTATSTNPAVVPDANLAVNSLGNGSYSLALEPVGVGYSRIILEATDGAATARGSMNYAASAQGYPDSRYHTFVSDASTAIPIDSEYMFVGDDENQVIRIYRRRASGDPVAGFDMTPYLGLTDIEDGRPREVDIEASTRVGNRIYWIGAHSHANIAEGRTNRSRLFATDVSGASSNSTLTYVGRYDFLKVDLVNWDASNGHGKGANYYGLAASTTEGVNPKAPDGSGFNIEGLVMAPFNTNVAWVGLRAPLVPTNSRTHALIVPVRNFAALASSGAGPQGSAVFGAPIELDLYGRGIRSIENIGSNYLIIAGIPGDFPGDYPNYSCFYTWTGNPADRPQERATLLQGLNPEGIIELPPLPWTADRPVHFLNDSGRTIWYGDDIPGKQVPVRNFKKYRSDILPLGAVVKTKPKVLLVERQGGNITIYWRSVIGDTYRVLYKSSFTDPSWVPLPGDVPATSTQASKTDFNPEGNQRFYKVEVLQ